MTMYCEKQLEVILAVVIVLFLFLVLKADYKRDVGVPVFNQKKEAVYELRGNIAKEGFYFFNEEQNMEELITACGGSRDELKFPNNAYEKVKKGTRVIFSTEVSMEKINTPALVNFFMPVSVNSASSEDLTLIPGIGIKTAKAIVAYRQSNKGIKDIHELIAVKGIGNKKLKTIMPYLTIEE
jgi:competence protein ComEA